MKFSEQSKLKAVTFSYDDGVSQDIKLIELLNKYGLKSTFNLNSGLLGMKNTITDQNGQCVPHNKVLPEDVRYIYAGHEVAVHTLTHPLLPDLDDKTVIYEVEQDRLNLSELAGYEVVGMAYPCGGTNYDDRVADLIKEHTGVSYCRTLINTDSFDKQSDLYRFRPNAHHTGFDRIMQLGQQFIELDAKTPQILYIWGHSYELDFDPKRWAQLEEFFKLISNRSDIFYGTNKEILL